MRFYFTSILLGVSLALCAKTICKRQGIVYHVSPKIQRHLHAAIKKIQMSGNSDIALLIDTKNISFLKNDAVHIGTSRFYEISIYRYAPYTEYRTGYTISVKGKRFPVFFNTTDDAFAQRSCNVDFKQFGGQGVLGFNELDVDKIVVDVQDNSVYTIDNVWKLKAKLEKEK
ncbi:MAG: hypothetical protein JNM41_14935 [Flavipsychrobacter sp.]|nr:hypothetical protein [Flavipsychrobacter sp.]